MILQFSFALLHLTISVLFTRNLPDLGKGGSWVEDGGTVKYRKDGANMYWYCFIEQKNIFANKTGLQQR